MGEWVGFEGGVDGRLFAGGYHVLASDAIYPGLDYKSFRICPAGGYASSYL